MKKFLAILVVLAMVGGCTAVNQFLCKPTEAQVEAANIGKAVAQSILVAAAAFSGNAVVALISQSALPVFNQIQQGYCVTQAQWDAAVAALKDANAQTTAVAMTRKGMKAIPTQTDITNAINSIVDTRW
jgi:hypothetical protein